MSEQHRSLPRREAPAVLVEITDWARAEAQVMPVRIAVFVVEQGVPEDIERDDFDAVSRHAIARDAGGVAPRQAVIRLLLGKTSLLAGAFLAGGYAALVLLALPALPAPLAITRVIHGGIAVIASVACSVAGRRLENACRVPPSSGDTDANTPAR